MKGLGGGIGAMLSDELAAHLDVCSGRADVSCVTLVLAVSAKHLHFDAHREILLFAHAFRRLAVDHNAAVANCPSRPIGQLLPGEPILAAKNVIGKGDGEEEMAETVLEFAAISVVCDLDDVIRDAKSVAEILSHRIALNLRRPTAQVLAVK